MSLADRIRHLPLHYRLPLLAAAIIVTGGGAKLALLPRSTGVTIPAPAATAPTPVAAISSTGVAPTSSATASAPLAAPEPVVPPAGAVPGWADRETAGIDTFGRPLRLAVGGVELPTVSVAATRARGDAWRRVEWRGWFRLASAMTVAQVAIARDAGTYDMRATAHVDAVDLAVPVPSTGDAADVAQTATALAAGWHRFRIVVDSAASGVGTLHVELRAGDGSAFRDLVPVSEPADDPIPATSTPAPAQASSAAPAAPVLQEVAE